MAADAPAAAHPAPAQAVVRSVSRASVSRVVPAVFLGTGIVYLTGSLFLPFTLAPRFGAAAPWLAAACAAMGLALLWLGRQARADRLAPRLVQPLAALVFAAISTQAVLYQLLLPGQPTAPTIFMLVVGAGLVVVELRYYVPLAAFTILEWAALPVFGHPGGVSQATSLASAAVAGFVANHLRRRGLAHQAATARALEDRERDLRAALADAHAKAETLRALSAGTTEGLVIHRDGALVEANEAFWTMFRLPPGARGGSRMEDRVAPGSRALVAKRMREHIEGPAEIEAIRGDGTTFWAEVETRNIMHLGVPARLAIVRDLTQRRAAEADRRKAEEGDRLAFERLLEIQQLRRLDEFKTAFLNTASHELNTPITPVRLQIHLLKSGQFGPLAPEQAHSVDVIDRNVARLSALVQDLLDVARLQGGQMKLQRSAADLSRLAKEALEAYQAPAAHRGVGLSLVDGAPAPVQADARRLSQVFANLLSNAVKFTPPGGRIAVRVAEAGDAWRVSVQDTGLGLERAQIARLFQPFSQVHDDPALRQAGTGLGLFICRGIVEAHGGRLWAESPGAGKGSTFHFELPRTVAMPREAEARPA